MNINHERCHTDGQRLWILTRPLRLLLTVMNSSPLYIQYNPVIAEQSSCGFVVPLTTIPPPRRISRHVRAVELHLSTLFHPSGVQFNSTHGGRLRDRWNHTSGHILIANCTRIQTDDKSQKPSAGAQNHDALLEADTLKKTSLFRLASLPTAHMNSVQRGGHQRRTEESLPLTDGAGRRRGGCSAAWLRRPGPWPPPAPPLSRWRTAHLKCSNAPIKIKERISYQSNN